MSTIFTLLTLLVFGRTPCSQTNTDDDQCPNGCRCTGLQISCTQVIPYTVPGNITEVNLSQLDPAELMPRRFCYVNWENVTKLFVHSVKLVGDVYVLHGGVFDCLGQIIEFKFRSAFLHAFSPETFSGLQNLQTFDLSGCRWISWDDLYQTLAMGTNFPDVTSLGLSGVATRQTVPLNFNQSFMDALAQRPVVHLDLSNTRLFFAFSDSQQLCQTLTFLNLSGSQFEIPPVFLHNKICKELRTVDFSGSKFFRSLIRGLSCVDRPISFNLDLIQFFKNVKTLHLNNIVSPVSEMKVSNCTFIPNTSISTVYFSGNFIPDVDVQLVDKPLKRFVMSNNHIETVSGQLLEHVPLLEDLDLSFNNLSHSGPSISVLLKHNNNLKSFNLSNNALTSLPEDTVLSNSKLESLILSHNRFQELPVRMSHLLNLRVLDLRSNSIQFLNETSRGVLDMLYHNQTDRRDSTSAFPALQVYLQGNPFMCNCEQLEFTLWFSSSPLFASFRHEYVCLSNGENVTMDERSVDLARQDCDRIKLRHILILLSTTIIPTVLLVTIVTAICLYKRHKKKKAQQRLADGIRRIRDNPDRYPVFLSYSSDEAELVRKHLLEPFEVSQKTQAGVLKGFMSHI